MLLPGKRKKKAPLMTVQSLAELPQRVENTGASRCFPSTQGKCIKKQICVFKPAVEHRNGVTARARAYIGLGASLGLICSCTCLSTCRPHIAYSGLEDLAREGKTHHCRGAKQRRGGRAQGTDCPGRHIPGKEFFQDHSPISTSETHPFGHPSWQGSRVCSGGAPARRCPPGLPSAYSLPEKMLSSSCFSLLPMPPFLWPRKFPMPTGVFQPDAEALADPPAIFVSPCSQALRGLSKPELLGFGLVVFLLALDAPKLGGNSCLSKVWFAKPDSTS